MTITINLPIFPLRREVAARRRRLARSLTAGPLAGALDPARLDARYSQDGLEFDVAGVGRLPQSPRAPR